MASKKINIQKINIEHDGVQKEHYKKDSFLIYTNSYESVKYLDDDQAGKLLKAMFFYNRGELEKVDDTLGNDKMLWAIWEPIKIYMDINADEYYQTCQTNSLNAKKGAAKKRVREHLLIEQYEKDDQTSILKLVNLAESELRDAENTEQLAKIEEKYKGLLNDIAICSSFNTPF